jgi:two-component system chemotaxis response regulator CheY
MRALIVDDSRAMRMVLKGILKTLGFETFEAGHGKEGLERLQEVGATDLALVDWNMPEMNGLEFVQAVRAIDAYGDTRLVMITTETDMARVSAALEAGANEYLMKPFTKEAVLDKLALLGLAAESGN